MTTKESHTTTSSSLPIRRTHSTPRLTTKNIPPYRPADASALVTTPLSSTDTSSGDEAVWIKPKGRAQFDCNICFDVARDPVVTQCGHLYCWPCLHQVPPSSPIQFAYIQWLSSPSIAPDPT